MNPLFQSGLRSAIRYALVFLSAYLVKHGIWTDSEAVKYVEASVPALAAFVWTVLEHYKDRVKFLTALMPGPKTEDDVKAHIAAGNATPTIFTPPNTIPGVPLTAEAAKAKTGE